MLVSRHSLCFRPLVHNCCIKNYNLFSKTIQQHRFELAILLFSYSKYVSAAYHSWQKLAIHFKFWEVKYVLYEDKKGYHLVYIQRLYQPSDA